MLLILLSRGDVTLCVCVCAFSLRWESPDMILGDEPFISEVVLSHYVKTTMNKRLLISESHDDSNWCTPYREKSDQHDTRFWRSVHVWPSAICISRGPHITTFRTFINRVEQGHCSWEKGLLTQSIARRLTDPWVRIQFLSWANQWSSGENQTSINSRLLGLPDPYHRHAISTYNTCSRGPTHRSLTDMGGGYNLGGAYLPHIHSPTFSTSCLPFPLVAPPGLQFN
jgi:hypothetical protein